MDKMVLQKNKMVLQKITIDLVARNNRHKTKFYYLIRK